MKDLIITICCAVGSVIVGAYIIAAIQENIDNKNTTESLPSPTHTPISEIANSCMENYLKDHYGRTTNLPILSYTELTSRKPNTYRVKFNNRCSFHITEYENYEITKAELSKDEFVTGYYMQTPDKNFIDHFYCWFDPFTSNGC